VYRNLRAGAESGKDYTARFMTDPDRLETIHTTDFIPIELNSMLWEYEDMIATAHEKAGRSRLAEEFRGRADRRQTAMDTYLWNESDGCYYDFDFRSDRQSDIKSMGMAYPVARGIATSEQGLRVATVLEQDLLKRGGFVSAAIESDQQWDAPNGFARDQIEGVNALRAIDDPRTAALATIAARRWLRRDEEIFLALGVLVEKNNVVSREALPGSGGEYPVQRDILWTNGVHRVFQRFLEAPA
jgi:alpha,alpha-trehalase